MAGTVPFFSPRSWDLWMFIPGNRVLMGVVGFEMVLTNSQILAIFFSGLRNRMAGSNSRSCRLAWCSDVLILVQSVPANEKKMRGPLNCWRQRYWWHMNTWLWIKTLVPFCSHRNSRDWWVQPLKICFERLWFIATYLPTPCTSTVISASFAYEIPILRMVKSLCVLVKSSALLVESVESVVFLCRSRIFMNFLVWNPHSLDVWSHPARFPHAEGILTSPSKRSTHTRLRRRKLETSEAWSSGTRDEWT